MSHPTVGKVPNPVMTRMSGSRRGKIAIGRLGWARSRVAVLALNGPTTEWQVTHLRPSQADIEPWVYDGSNRCRPANNVRIRSSTPSACRAAAPSRRRHGGDDVTMPPILRRSNHPIERRRSPVKRTAARPSNAKLLGSGTLVDGGPLLPIEQFLPHESR